MSLAVHILHEVTGVAMVHLRARLRPGVQLTVGPNLPERAECDILVAGRPEREHILACPELQAVIVPFAGLPQETRALMLGFPRIAVHNLHHNATAAAEMAVTLMLAAAKFIVPSDRALRHDDWRPRYDPNPAVLMEAKTVVILGYGAIGQRIAPVCRGLGMEVMAVRRRIPPEAAEDVFTSDALPSLLPRADVLILALPLTAETEGLIGRKELSLLPARAVLVNVGRGPLVDEEALFRALSGGVLHAAELDVWYSYPQDEASRERTPPAAYPFHTLENVVMSPHRAGSGGAEEIEMRRMDHLAKLLNAAASGDDMPNRVNVEVGY